jgi:hypothetical protein
VANCGEIIPIVALVFPVEQAVESVFRHVIRPSNEEAKQFLRTDVDLKARDTEATSVVEEVRRTNTAAGAPQKGPVLPCSVPGVPFIPLA